MGRHSKWLLAFGMIGALALAAAARGEEGSAPPAAAADPDFERLKQLAGEWVDATSDAAAAKGVVSVYRVTAAESAVVETLFPGSPHEMVTVYYLDGKDLVLTHYCAFGNQPHMKADRPAGGPDKVVFRFAGGSNVRPDQDAHMHEATITFLGADRIRAEWSQWNGGKKADVKVFELKRKKD